MSGLVLLLPHGYEGQGPEHSSARLERYLQLCAEDNIQVCNLTTCGELFPRPAPPDPPQLPQAAGRLHAEIAAARQGGDLARSTIWGRAARSTASIGEAETIAADDEVRRVVLCSGKVYFDLVKARAEQGDDRVALVRVEQLYPFPFITLGKMLQRYRNAEIVWCQEEPQNMGAWSFVDRRIEQVLAGLDIAAKRPRFAGRAEAASPATGLFKRHVEEQAQLVADALAA